LTLFGSLFLACLLVALLVGMRPVAELVQSGTIKSQANAVIAVAGVVLAFMSLSLGLVLSSVNQRLLELEKVIIKRIQRSRLD